MTNLKNCFRKDEPLVTTRLILILEDMKVDDSEFVAQNLIDTYTNDLGCELREELVQFA